MFFFIVEEIEYRHFFFILTWGQFFIAFIKRKAERERNINVRNINWLLLGSPAGYQTHNLVCALTRNQTHNFLVYGTILQPNEPHWPGLENFKDKYLTPSNSSFRLVSLNLKLGPVFHTSSCVFVEFLKTESGSYMYICVWFCL